jgi:hypothetical protein
MDSIVGISSSLLTLEWVLMLHVVDAAEHQAPA